MSARGVSNQLNSYENDGWVISSRNGDHATLKKTSSIAENIARSVGYVLAAPFVCVSSLVGATLTILVAPCCCTAMAAQAKKDGDFSQSDKFMKVAEEGCSGQPAIRCLEINKVFFDWAQPFQSVDEVKTISQTEQLHED